MNLAEATIGRALTVLTVAGERATRLRLMELGLVPGATVRVVARAPLGDPLRLALRSGQLSIRRREAAAVGVSEQPEAVPALQAAAAAAFLAGDGR